VFIHDDGSSNVVYTGLTMDLLSQLAVNIGFCYNVTYVPGVWLADGPCVQAIGERRDIIDAGVHARILIGHG
jgi:hypothetical protein